MQKFFSANRLRLSPAGEVVQGFACGEFLLKGPKAPDQKSVGRPKPLGAQRPTPFWWGAHTPVAEGKKNLLSLKAANSRTRGKTLLWWYS